MAAVRIDWKPSLSATCLHAAACLVDACPAVDPELAAALEPASAALLDELATIGTPPQPVLRAMLAQASEIEQNPALVAHALTRLVGPVAPDDPRVRRLAGRLADLEAALARARPRIAEELAVRGGPLREQWEARGPGVLHEMSRLAGCTLAPQRADVTLVLPYAGGHGRAFADANRCLLEAVLYHPAPELPEPLRLAWLLGQLQIDLPPVCDAISGPQAARAAALATVPLALVAGQEVEWTQATPEMLHQALVTWHVPASPAAEAALWQWWETFAEGGVAWPTALAALAAMLGPSGDLDVPWPL